MKNKQKQCYFCQRNIQEIDFKNTDLLERFMSDLHKIQPRYRTHLCAKHQKELATCIKRARDMGLLPYGP